MQNTNYDAILRMILKYNNNRTNIVTSIGSSIGATYDSSNDNNGGGDTGTHHVDSDEWYNYVLLYNDDEDLIGFTSNTGTWTWMFVKDSFDDLYRVNVVTPNAKFHIGLIWENFDFRLSDLETDDKGKLIEVVLVEDTPVVVDPPVSSKTANYSRDVTYTWYKTRRNTNVYGNNIDLMNAEEIFGNAGYTYIPTDGIGYVPPIFKADDIVVGGTGATGGIVNSGLAIRLWGINRDETAIVIRNYANLLDDSQFVSGTGNTNPGVYYSGKTTIALGWSTSDTYAYHDGQYSGTLNESTLNETLIGWVTQQVYNELSYGAYCGTVKVTETFTGTVYLIT